MSLREFRCISIDENIKYINMINAKIQFWNSHYYVWICTIIHTKSFAVWSCWTDVTDWPGPVGLVHSWWTARLVPAAYFTEVTWAAGVSGGLWYILALRAIITSKTVSIRQGQSIILAVFTSSAGQTQWVISVSCAIWKEYQPDIYTSVHVVDQDSILNSAMYSQNTCTETKHLLENVPGWQGTCVVVPSGQ